MEDENMEKVQFSVRNTLSVSMFSPFECRYVHCATLHCAVMHGCRIKFDGLSKKGKSFSILVWVSARAIQFHFTYKSTSNAFRLCVCWWRRLKPVSLAIKNTKIAISHSTRLPCSVHIPFSMWQTLSVPRIACQCHNSMPQSSKFDYFVGKWLGGLLGIWNSDAKT